ncbi:CPBP family intramembrane metalloprotease [Sulfitobacter albidus]|uniref:CPBP family intramembrane metalloprotease n=1 Tax=Sulfitobacter albidus TaxID=2829501 RepID=A0A975JDE2_9RHOB|nr:type II CAAX endopeptidase family protein [Sulfitobacter albidus]QUJ76419.1 CPBP family intramembrane metalloprotease [Sulfitobacter albidus]
MWLLRPDYDAHILHIKPAETRPELWRTVVALVAMTVMYILLSLFYQQAIFNLFAGASALTDTIEDGTSPLAVFVILFNFALISLSVALVVKMMHARGTSTLFGPAQLALSQFMRVTGALLVFMAAVAVLPPWGMGGILVPNLGVVLWLVLLPLGLVAVFVQISAEELLFRGYLQQQMAVRFRSPLIWMGVPSFLFAIGHYQPGAAGENAVLLVVWAGIFGLLMADLTARSGSLGPALAIHFINNVFALLVTSLPDTLGGLALYHTPFGLDDAEALRAWLPVDFVSILCMWLVARLALRR